MKMKSNTNKNRYLAMGVLVALSITFTATISAKEVDNPAKGWHWYEKELPPEVIEAIKEEIKEQVETKLAEEKEKQEANEPKVGSTAWISENLPKFRQRAGDDPTSENIRALLYLERILIDRAAVLGRRAQVVAQSDPYLDTSFKSTSNTTSARNSRLESDAKSDKLIQRLIKDGLAIWLFITPNCQTCDYQVDVLQNITRVHGLPVLFILMDGAKAPVYKYQDNAGLWESIVDKGHSKSFPLLATPTSYAYDNKTGEYILVTQGLSTIDTFKERILIAADYAGWATPQEIEATRFGNDVVNLGLFDFNDIQGDMTDSATFLRHIETKMLEGKKID